MECAQKYAASCEDQGLRREASEEAKHIALPGPGRADKHLGFPREGESLLWAVLGCYQARLRQGEAGKLNIWPGIWAPQKGRAHPLSPPHRFLYSPEPGSLGGTVLPMLGRRYSMLGTDCGSLSSTGVCNQKEESGGSLQIVSPRASQADGRVRVSSMSGAPSVGTPGTRSDRPPTALCPVAPKRSPS